MTLAAAIEAELPFLRSQAESLMLDTCRVTKPGTGPRVLDPVTLEYTDPAPVTVYEGKCKLQRAFSPAVAQAPAGDATWDVLDLFLHLPMAGTDDVGADQTVTYLTSTSNPSLVDRQFGLLAVVEATLLTARRCRVREVVSD